MSGWEDQTAMAGRGRLALFILEPSNAVPHSTFVYCTVVNKG
jgi:hypothetical protein